MTAEAGLTPRNHPTGITFVDYDHDGDLDLLLTGAPLKPGGAPNVLWRNNGNKTFTEWTEPTGLGGSGTNGSRHSHRLQQRSRRRHCRHRRRRAPLIYVNPREGKYPTQPSYENDRSFPPPTGIAVLDFNKDGWMDIAVTHAGAPGSPSGATSKAPTTSAAASSALNCRIARTRCADGASRHRYR